MNKLEIKETEYVLDFFGTLEYLQIKLSLLINKYGPTAYFDGEVITYYRKETDEEYNIRIQTERTESIKIRKRKESIEKRNKTLYENLKKKYDSTGEN